MVLQLTPGIQENRLHSAIVVIERPAIKTSDFLLSGSLVIDYGAQTVFVENVLPQPRSAT